MNQLTRKVEEGVKKMQKDLAVHWLWLINVSLILHTELHWRKTIIKPKLTDSTVDSNSTVHRLRKDRKSWLKTTVTKTLRENLTFGVSY